MANPTFTSRPMLFEEINFPHPTVTDRMSPATRQMVMLEMKATMRDSSLELERGLTVRELSPEMFDRIFPGVRLA